MTMTKEAIEKVLEIGTVETHKIGEQIYATQRLHLVQEPTPAEIVLRSLSGLVGYVKSEFDTAESLMIHIENPTTVSVFTAVNGDKRRSVYIQAQASIPRFGFSNFHDREEFNIALQSGFVQNTHRDIVLKVVGTVVEGAVKEIGDDGVSQAVTAKTSVANRENVKVPNPVELSPYRTFVEVEQPESKFVFRMREGARCGLFEADGGAWKLEAMNNIKEYLNNELAQEIKSKKVFILA
ncbi:hypothetical protein [Bacillus toyonensis]|uniref:hypothetical protein n=1 Tax=Bacillus toyonensis TaxID=155322 RepID=UPI000BFC605B|nr:hypothetical protein [Bacillus toyonensis]MDR4971645.1 hypothetical protein [Bacillus toyonensis]PHA89481.1 hypothetical protein COE74_09640 [Bacillus toyonensis]PHC96217.1 hypothetical protein COF54_30900 [Bacillus toyonensis]